MSILFLQRYKLKMSAPKYSKISTSGSNSSSCSSVYENVTEKDVYRIEVSLSSRKTSVNVIPSFSRLVDVIVINIC